MGPTLGCCICLLWYSWSSFSFCILTKLWGSISWPQPNKSQCYEGDGYLAKIEWIRLEQGRYLGCRRLWYKSESFILKRLGVWEFTERNICWTVKGYMCVHSKLNEWCHKHGGLWESSADKSINWISVFIDCSSQFSCPSSEGDGKYRFKSKFSYENPLLVPIENRILAWGCGVCTSVTIRWDESVFAAPS